MPFGHGVPGMPFGYGYPGTTMRRHRLRHIFSNLAPRRSDRASAPCLRQAPYPILSRIEYIGRYMAATMNPMIPPRTVIRIGSISFMRPETAVSTSSS